MMEYKFLLSFKNFLQYFITESIQFDKYGDESGTVHLFKDDENIVSVNYSPWAGKHHNYEVDFTLNGNWDWFHKGTNNPKARQLLYHGVKKSFHEFVKDHKPNALIFKGNTVGKHAAWGYLGNSMAKKLGGKFEPAKDENSSHRIEFENK